MKTKYIATIVRGKSEVDIFLSGETGGYALVHKPGRSKHQYTKWQVGKRDFAGALVQAAALLGQGQ